MKRQASTVVITRVSSAAVRLISRHFDNETDIVTGTLVAMSVEEVTSLVMDSIEAGREIERGE